MLNDIGKPLAILASIAAIIGTCIAVIALIPAFGAWLSPREPIQYTAPSDNGSPNTVFATANPSSAQSESPTAIPEIASVPDTLPNTLLEVGQTWHQGNSELILKNTQLDNFGYDMGNVIVFELIFINQKSNDISFRYVLGDNFSATDNYGNRLRMVYSSMDQYAVGWDQENRTVKAGDSINLSSSDEFAIVVDTGNPNITEVILTVANISNITQAQWRIPVYH